MYERTIEKLLRSNEDKTTQVQYVTINKSNNLKKLSIFLRNLVSSSNFLPKQEYSCYDMRK